MNGFYSLDDTIDLDGLPVNILRYAEHFVASPEYYISRTEKDTYQFPIHGWYWFESEEEAKAFFNLTD